MDLRERDQAYIWHPLTQHQTSEPPIPLAGAQGALLIDTEGKEDIDGISSWYTAMFGHCHPKIVTAAAEQMQTMDQVVFSGFTHGPAVNLAEQLLDKLPSNQKKIFFNDNGSTSVEAALKMALQYFHNKGEQRTTFVAFEEGFHGDTFGAMSASGLSVYNGPFETVFADVKRIPVPTDDTIDEVVLRLKELFLEHNCAAFIYEPLVQGAAGMKMHKASHLEALLRICGEHDVLTIADEVMTGFGKTGRDFASLWMTTQPDLICLSKALTAGLVPMGITSCSGRIFDGFLDDDVAKGFLHAHTYSANPIACAAAVAALELLSSEEIQQNISQIEMAHKEFGAEMRMHSKVREVRYMGVVLALDLDLEIDRYGDVRNKLFKYFMQEGVFLRPLGNTIYTVPPYITEDDQLEKIYAAMRSCLELV